MLKYTQRNRSNSYLSGDGNAPALDLDQRLHRLVARRHGRKNNGVRPIVLACSIVIVTLGSTCSEPGSGDADSFVATDDTIEQAHLSAPRHVENADVKTQELNDWAGRYTRPKRELILSKQTFQYQQHFPGTFPMLETTRGDIEISDDGAVALNPKDPEDAPRGLLESERRLYMVQWGDRRYLLSEDDVIDVINDANSSLRLPRTYWLHAEDEKRKIHGQPNVPEAYAHYLFDQPLHAEVVATHDPESSADGPSRGVRRTPITIDAGGDKGVWQGMHLFWQSSRDEYREYGLSPTDASIRVTSVGKTKSRGVVRQFIGEEGEVPTPEPGWALSTRRPEHHFGDRR